ncbi:hypothetical protein CLU79DRAFT_778953 [Phycomyces nitens]|nr:hypothetical protein CLU79DRAFT_778953 [Phycomyces nitens]
MDSTRGSAGSTQVLQDSEYDEESARVEFSNPDEWKVVPFVGPTMPSSEEAYTPSALARWRDPEDPHDRLAKEHIPLGLCPPSHHFSYTPALFQALFHIPLFKRAVLDFRPTPVQWGNPLNYWKGFGDAVSPLIYSQDQAGADPDTYEEDSTSYTQPQERIAETEDGWPDISNPALKSKLENDLVSMPMSLRVMAETQKLFGFLSLSKRRYGNVSPVIRALSARMASPHWEFSDRNVDGFLDMFIGCLIEADSLAAGPERTTPMFRDLFLIKALVEYSTETEIEEIFYLTLGIEYNTKNIHECLDPLVYESESFKAESDGEVVGDGVGVGAGDDTEQTRCKVTTFEQIPPILIVTLEDRSEATNSSVDFDSIETFNVDHTIYLDRYLSSNKAHAKTMYRQAEQWRTEIAQIKRKQRHLNEVKIDDHLKYSSQSILQDTLSYLKTKPAKVPEDRAKLEATESLILSASEHIKEELKDLANEEKELVHRLDSLFSEPEMQKARYDLHCSVHTDGLDGKGHTWAYIKVNHTESEAHWFRFSDAAVEPVSEERVRAETMPTLMLFYVSADAEVPETLTGIPMDLVTFVCQDNAQFEDEIYSATAWQNIERIPISATTSEGSLVFEDGDSVGTAVGCGPTNADSDTNDGSADAPLSPHPFDELWERRERLVEVANQSTETEILEHFHLFLAKAGNKDALDHYIDLYWHDPNNREDDKARRDEELSWVLGQFDSYVRVGKRVARGLIYFGQGDHRKALQAFVEAKREEGVWKTDLLVNSLSVSYPGLETLGFSATIERFGKQCLKILNAAAYQKVKHPSYRTRGLEDALWIAHQAHTIIGPELLGIDPVFGQLGEIWFGLTDEIGEQPSTGLTAVQAELLNTLMMTYLDGQTGYVKEPEVTAEEDSDGVAVWEMYRQGYRDANQVLEQINKQ